MPCCVRSTSGYCCALLCEVDLRLGLRLLILGGAGKKMALNDRSIYIFDESGQKNSTLRSTSHNKAQQYPDEFGKYSENQMFLPKLYKMRPIISIKVLPSRLSEAD